LNYAIFPRLAYRMDKSVLVNTAMLPLSSLQRSAASLVTTHRGHFLPTSASHGFPHPCLWAGRQHFAQENTPCSFSPLERGLPHFVLRYRQMRPETARNALLATHGGLSLEWSAEIGHIPPMALYRLVCTFGHHGLVTVLTRCGLPLPVYFLADEKHSHCLTDKVYLPTIVRGRVLWHLGYSEAASAVAFRFHRIKW